MIEHVEVIQPWVENSAAYKAIYCGSAWLYLNENNDIKVYGEESAHRTGAPLCVRSSYEFTRTNGSRDPGIRAVPIVIRLILDEVHT